MKNRLRFGITCWFALLSWAAADERGASTNPVVVTSAWVEALVVEARPNQPALRAADLRADAALWQAASIRTWEDPVARFGVMASDRAKQADDGNLLYGVEQKLPLFGKPQAARALAQAEALTQRHEAAFRTRQLRRELHRQLLKVALEARLLELGRQDEAALATVTVTTEDKYRNGLATQVEVLQAQNERARRGSQLRTEDNLLRAELATVNRLLNRPPDTTWPRLILPEPVSALPSVEEMWRHATLTAPQLEVGHASVRQAESAVALARKQHLPEVSVGIDGRQFSGTGEFREGIFTLGISLPWGNRSRYAAEVKREERKREAAQYEVAEMQLGLRDEINRLSIQIENAQREAVLYRGEIIPRTEQALAGAQANWLNNRGALRDVLEARRMLLEAQTMEARAQAEQNSLLAEIFLHCGMSDLAHPTAAAPAGIQEKAP